MIKDTAKRLKQFLDDIGFHGIFKYLGGMNNYYVSPYRLSHSSEIDPAHLDVIVAREDESWLLLHCLLLTEEVSYSALTAEEKIVADALVEDRFLKLEGDRLCSLGFQVISFHGLYLMIDGCINFPRHGNHEVYIGIDTYLMLYYLDTARITPDSKCLDLCTGTSISGLYMSSFSNHVTVTDIAPKPLLLSQFNAYLNGREQSLCVRAEDFNITLDNRELFDFVTCNPPFVAFPEELQAPIFARGYDKDGLGHYRLLLEKIKNYLAPHGTACFVADFIGDENQPYFVNDLRDYARRKNLDINLYIDNRITLADQMTAYPYFVQKRNPQYTIEEVRQRSEHFLANELQVKYYYLSTIVIRNTSSVPRLRVLNRFLGISTPAPVEDSFNFHQVFPHSGVLEAI